MLFSRATKFFFFLSVKCQILLKAGDAAKYTKGTPRKRKQKGNKDPQKPTMQPPTLTLETQYNYKKTPPTTQPNPKPHKTNRAFFPLP